VKYFRLFRPYFYGTHFRVVTDHVALQWLITTKDLSGKLARWSLKLLKLQEYTFDIEYGKGKLNQVDALTRLPRYTICLDRVLKLIAFQLL
jgi:hypothetical protein